MELLIAGGRVLDPEGELDRPPVEDILIRDGRIAARGEGARREGVPVLDAAGLLVCPGFVNAHSHSHDALLRGCFENLPLEAWGLLAFPSGWARRDPAEIHLRAKLHGAECLRGGITTVQDMVTIVGADAPHVDATLDAYREIGIRAVMALQIADRAGADTLPFAEAFAHHLPGALDVSALQSLIEARLGQGGERLHWGIGPSAPQRCSPALLGWAAALARAGDLPVFIHLYETRSQAVHARQRLGVTEGSHVDYLARLGLLSPRLVVAHGVWTAPEEIAALGREGVHLAHNPAANLKLLNGVAPLRDYAQAGVGLALGCDNSSAGDAQSMFVAMRHCALAWSLQGPAGEEGGAAIAYRAATLGGAAALGLAGEVGCLRPGARADLALFDLAAPAWWPLNSAVRQLVHAESGASLRHVLVQGEIVLRDGRLARASEAALTTEAEQAQLIMAPELAALRERTAPLRAALLAMHERVKAEPLPYDRLRLD